MPRLLVSFAELADTLRRRSIDIDGIEHVDVLGLIDDLREFIPVRSPIPVTAPDDPPARPPSPPAGNPLEECPHCGARGTRSWWLPDPPDGTGNDSAYCTACNRHWRTGHPEHVWRGRAAGADGPAPLPIPPAPLLPEHDVGPRHYFTDRLIDAPGGTSDDDTIDA